MLWSGCSLQPLQQQLVGDLGRIEFRKSESQINGIVVGVSHGVVEPAAIDYANSISAETGAALVIAYGFGSKRISVAQPLVRRIGSAVRDPGRRGSIYPEFKAALRTAANGPVKFYVGIRIADPKNKTDRIEVVSSGISLAQLKVLKEKYLQRRNGALLGRGIEKTEIAVDPLDEIAWSIGGLKHHGVLMHAERGLNLRLPARLASGPARDAYRSILSQWIGDAIAVATQDPATLPRVEVAVLRYGKIEMNPSAGRGEGIVVGAPHGTFDAHTAGMVRQICFHSGLAGVIATGFTPTESGDGWRINVNRPSERHGSLSDWEIETTRAKLTYEQFKRSVLKAARGTLDLYIDIHQNGGSRIEVATVGISKEEARQIKDVYRSLRDQALAGRPEIAPVDLAIEPLDEIEVGAWAAKANGILAVAKKSLHLELPAYGVMASEKHRDVYMAVLAGLIDKIAPRISATPAPANLSRY